MNDNINGYILKGDFRTDNSGTARWGFAQKDGQEVFIKEFLEPTYPVETGILSQKLIESKRQSCEMFYNTKRRLYDAVNACKTGNTVGILDFFRHEAKYYIITEKIDSIPLTMEDISEMPLDHKLLICKIIIFCVRALHEHHIVHCDIKHDNILFKRTTSGKRYVAKIIDFDASFLENELPDPDEEFHGDSVYYAPESFLYMLGEIDHIDAKIDVFALGLLFHQYFSGQLPYFDKESFDYAHEAVLDGMVLVSNDSVPQEYAAIINDMLKFDPKKRPDLNEFFKRFTQAENHDKDDKELSPEEKAGFRIAGDL